MPARRERVKKPRVAVIGTGGTIASVGARPLDLLNYSATGIILDARALVASVPALKQVASVRAVPFRAVPSTRLGWAEWKALLGLCDRLVARDPALAGIVIAHGTATMEETAYFLSLTLKVSVPVVLTGAQRPSGALSGDGPMNLVNAVRVAASPAARGLGALIVMNDEIHAAREVTKTATLRLQTFRTADFGVLGHADEDSVAMYRRPLRRVAPETEFDVRKLAALPRVDIAYAHADAGSAAISGFIATGAKGIVVAGFAPAGAPPAMTDALEEAARGGVIVVMATRAGSGRVVRTLALDKRGFLPADNLTPQKARILLAIALTVTDSPDEIRRIFAEY